MELRLFETLYYQPPIMRLHPDPKFTNDTHIAIDEDVSYSGSEWLLGTGILRGGGGAGGGGWSLAARHASKRPLTRRPAAPPADFSYKHLNNSLAQMGYPDINLNTYPPSM